jgi:hypothetical protein
MFGMEKCNLIHYWMFEVCNFPFVYTGSHSPKFAMSLRGDFDLRLLRHAGTDKTLWTLGDELN